eukprot:GILJ01006182.1.p1 GENE.GILJ01006182.1~~GILJ01006182.1.p1  ORF type:complete len:742 (-),score=83.25 GILJ01006182.1:22-2247(-)
MLRRRLAVACLHSSRWISVSARLELWEAAKRRFDAYQQARFAATTPLELEIDVMKGTGPLKLPAAQGQSILAAIASAKKNPTYKDIDHILSKLQRESVVGLVSSSTSSDKLWDLTRPLEQSCSIRLLTFEDTLGKATYWHSAAHVLGQALEKQYGARNIRLCDGPALLEGEGGFFYEFGLDAGKTTGISTEDFEAIVSYAKEICKARQVFERIEVEKDVAKAIFEGNEFKQYMIDKFSNLGQQLSLYRCGDLVDLCRGPHVPNTGLFKGFDVVKVSAAYWLGNPGNAQLQRVYGIAFPTQDLLQEYKKRMEEAKERDHRVIGKKQELFMFHALSPGSAFFLPHGTRIYNKLVEFLRNEYRTRGYQEVMSPLLYRSELWRTSGHWEHYKEDMFVVNNGCSHSHVLPTPVDAETNKELGKSSAEELEDGDGIMALKPMNCPGHCLIFAASKRSYRELPLRLADFSSLHRNEATGALSGLTRLRRFQQDDAHIFCTHEQVMEEIKGCLDFVDRMYSIFGFEFSMKLSTRPEKYVGELDVWDKAEKALQDALNSTGKSWSVNDKDGAFYGPKIDISVTDALKRQHQCATIQLDFQMPQRFGLEYQKDDGKLYTPVIIHRAILGSVERFMAILMEHTAGKWPLWLSPRQVAICPVSQTHLPFAREICRTLLARHSELYVDVDESDGTLNKKIRDAQLAQYNYILVVGNKELESRTLSVRERSSDSFKNMQVDEFANAIKQRVEAFK